MTYKTEISVIVMKMVVTIESAWNVNNNAAKDLDYPFVLVCTSALRCRALTVSSFTGCVSLCIAYDIIIYLHTLYILFSKGSRLQE